MGWETTIYGPESAFVAFSLPIHSSYLYCHERAGWARKNWLCPRAQEPLGTPLFTVCYWLQLNERYLPIFAVDPTASCTTAAKFVKVIWNKKKLKISKSSRLKILLNIRFVGAALSTYAVSFIAALNAWCAVTCCMYRERWITVPLWLNNITRARSSSYLKALWRICESNCTRALDVGDTSNYALKSHLRFATAHFANLGCLDEICWLDTSNLWLSTFWKSQLLTSVVNSYFVIIT